jgi:hypothetical protein
MFEKSQMIVSDPMAYKYYGSMNTLESYWKGVQQNEAEKKFGKDYLSKVDEYFALNNNPDTRAEAKQLYKQLKMWEYFDFMDASQRQINIKIGSMLNELPDGPEVYSREGEQMNINSQEMAINIANELSPSMMAEVQNYYSGEEMDDYAKLKLERIANKYDMSSNEVLQYLAMVLQ